MDRGLIHVLRNGAPRAANLTTYGGGSCNVRPFEKGGLHGDSMDGHEKPWENYGKMLVSWWFHGILRDLPSGNDEHDITIENHHFDR